MPRRTDSAPSRSVPAGQVGKGYAVKILILGNQARSTSNFWTVLMRRMRAAGHEVLCAVPAGDDAAEAAIRAIGSTPTAILGALEPLTALFFGVVVFGERLTPRIVLGVVLILAAVTLIIAGRSLHIPFPHLRFRRAR